MKKMLTILSLVSISLTAFGKEKCVSADILTEQQRINQTEGLSDESRRFLLNGTFSLKMVQILACTSMKKKISKADSEFAVAYMEDDAKTKIAKLERDAEYMQTALNDQETNDIIRTVYTKSLELIPQEIEREKQTTQAIIKDIKKLTRNF